MRNFVKYVILFALAVLLSTSAKTTAMANDYEDPEYGKYNQMTLMSGGSNWTIADSEKKLSHQERFGDKYQKEYGIDVSKWQGEIDWEKAKNDGVKFAIIRLGYRGMSSGTLEMDEWFEINVKNAHKAGVDIGVYFFTQAITTKEARQEANFCVSKLKKYKNYIDYPIMYDIEPCGGRLDKANLSVDKKTKLCLAFCKQIQSKGYYAGVYSSKYFYETWFHTEQLEKQAFIWMANYANSTSYQGVFQMWQFSSRGKINGINGYVDLDVVYLPVRPEAPKNLEQTDLSEKGVTLSWSPVVAVDGYKVSVYDQNGQIVVNKSTVKKTTQLDCLEPNRIYYAKIRSFYKLIDGSTKFSSYSNTIKVKTGLAGVSQITITNQTTTSVTVKWKKQNNAVGYKLWLYDEASKSYKALGVVKENTYRISNLNSAKNYQIKIRAYMRFQQKTQFGAVSPATDIYTIPQKVKGLSATAVKGSTLSMTWKQPIRVEKNKVVLLSGKGKVLQVTVTTGNHCTFGGLDPFTNYRVKVIAFTQRKDGTKNYAEESTAYAVKTGPATVTGIREKSCTTSTIQLGWNAVNGAEGYRIYLKNPDTGIFKVYKHSKKNEVTLEGLSSGNEYQIKIVAYVKRNNKSCFGDVGSPVTLCTRTINVRQLKKVESSGNSVAFSWKKSVRATGYIVKLYDKKGVFLKKQIVKTNYCQFTGLKRGSYTVKVKSFLKTKDNTVFSTGYKSLDLKIE